MPTKTETAFYETLRLDSQPQPKAQTMTTPPTADTIAAVAAQLAPSIYAALIARVPQDDTAIGQAAISRVANDTPGIAVDMAMLIIAKSHHKARQYATPTTAATDKAL